MAARLDTIQLGVHKNLQDRKFMYVPADEARYWDNPFIFGDEFLILFPKAAKRELMDAGNCIAAGMWTASAFHAIRVAEYGLWKLAKRIGAQIIDKKQPAPIDLATWQKLIEFRWWSHPAEGCRPALRIDRLSGGMCA
jgi:hypothetical protein